MTTHVSKLLDQAARLKPPVAYSAMQALWPLVAAIGVGLFMFYMVGPWLGGYRANIAVFIGINIILAVSLTLVNGFTGQFSMGHAGFMALGGYAAASVVYYGSMRFWGSAEFAGGALSYSELDGFVGPLIGKGDVLFLIACLAGGLIAQFTRGVSSFVDVSYRRGTNDLRETRLALGLKFEI